MTVASETITALRCKCEVCGHEWITEREPKRCAKCKTWRWNFSGRREGAVVSVRMGQDGAKGGGVQGVGAVEDEQLRGGVRKGRVQSGDESKRVKEGRELILKARSLGMTTAMRDGLDVAIPQKPVAKKVLEGIHGGVWYAGNRGIRCVHHKTECKICGGTKGAK